MGFWEDSSPVVKIALIVGVLGILYMGIAWAVGLFPFPGKCTHTPQGSTEEVAGCPAGAECTDGECVVAERGLHRTE